MIRRLLRILDQQRAFEVIDFVVIFSLLLAVAMLVLYVLLSRRTRTMRRELERSSAEIYYFLLPTLALDADDHRLIKRMAAFLPFPQQKHRIMVNAQVFDRCARRLIATEEVEPGVLNSLRGKLGFPADIEDFMPLSSRDLVAEVPVLVVQEGRPAVRGRVISVGEACVEIQTEDNAAAIRTDGAVVVYFQNRAGFFTFETSIESIEQQLLRLAHSQHIKRYQRRRYSRKNVKLPVFVRPYQSGAKSLKSIMFDLSGGGASVRNPSGRLQVDQQVELSFAPGVEKFHVLGQIVRTSNAGALIHIEFQALDSTARDRMIRAIS